MTCSAKGSVAGSALSERSTERAIHLLITGM